MRHKKGVLKVEILRLLSDSRFWSTMELARCLYDSDVTAQRQAYRVVARNLRELYYSGDVLFQRRRVSWKGERLYNRCENRWTITGSGLKAVK